MISPSHLISNQVDTSAMNDQPLLPHATLFQYIVSLLPLLETSSSSVPPSRQSNCAHESKTMLLALAFIPDQPSYALSCSGHMTKKPMHASDPTDTECSEMMNNPIALPSSISISSADGQDGMSEVSFGARTLSATTSALPMENFHSEQVVHE
jgi:hypothetical protein